MRRTVTRLLLPTLLGATLLAGCGGGDERATGAGSGSTSAAGSAGAAPAGLQPIKAYLLEHTARLTTETAVLRRQADEYAALVEGSGGEAQALREDRAGVQRLVTGMQATWRKANPSYEEAEGIVAGVPELDEYDRILDAGTDGSAPETAVPFDLTYADGTKLTKPGNYFFLTETSLWGTEAKFTAGEDVEADLNDDGKVTYGEALPKAQHIRAAAKGFDEQAKQLAAASARWKPTTEDVFNAVVVMTPTMAEYFEAWKNSRFVAGDDADESSFVGTSRLADISGILSGLTVVYDGIEPEIAKEDPQQAEQTGRSLDDLLTYVDRIKAREDDGDRFTAEQADSLGTEAQRRAENIAGQVSQAAAALGIEVEA